MKTYKNLNSLILAVFFWAIAFGIAQPAAYASSNLTDINGHWAQGQIEHLIAQDIIGGYPDSTFKPDQTITRAEFTVVLVKAFKLKASNVKDFTDTTNNWAKSYIATASACGVVSGYGNGSFGPNDPITREQMAVMVVNAAKLDTVAAGNVFTDESKISKWAKGSVNTASSYKIISGYPNNSFQPQLSATRAEAMVVINQAIFKTVPGAAITGLGLLQMGENTTDIASTTEPGAGGWTSSDKTVAKVNVNTGAVVALKAGTTEIAYTLSSSEKVNSKSITVYPQPIVNNPTIGVVRVGSGTVKPTSYDVPDATETITWSSSDTAIATIDKKTGEITAVKAGDTIIAYKVVKDTTGNIVTRGSLTLTVIPAAVQGAPVTGIGLLQIGETITAAASTTEPGARGWTSSNPAVATINATTGSIKALAAGTANIGYTISTSGNINSKAITVYASPTINNPSIGVVKVGAGTVKPTGFTKPAADETIGWTSSDPSRATINSATGAITPAAPGNTTISYAVIKTGRIIAMGYLIVTVQA